MFPPRLRSGMAIPALLMLVLITLTWLRPAPPAPDASSAPSLSGDLAPGSAAMRARINPETGELEISAGMPDLSLDPATKESLRRDSEGLIPVYHPDGSVSVNLQGRFQSAAVARLDEQGSVIVCSEQVDELNSVRDGSAGAPASKSAVQ